MNLPRIAVPVPTSTNLEYNRKSWPQYAAALREAGAEPVEVPLNLGEAAWREIADTCDGVLLPGSPADVAPERYGQEADPATAKADSERETLDFLLMEDAVAKGKPVLGICFGLQSMNTWRGGSLVQDLMPAPVNHSAGAQVAVAHTALIAADSLLGSLVDREEAVEADHFLRLPVNTSHHQAVAVPGDGLRVVARCPEDGVIEALEADAGLDGSAEQFLVGVQWHPERSTAISASSRALFQRLVQEAARVRAER
ncbi:MAG: gamma-glutamyl-gamma-aminobutyrate hydrolase family protein [Acidobacteriaceae bacterium]|nr:gamma-glutamyl-gamma-aminobutyrate hydrolase family protein [Acidobacteriaceae bacterium]